MLINSPNISGSLTVTGNSVITGSLTVLGGINGAITGSAATASYVEYSNVANKPTLVSGSEQITYSGLTGIPSGIVSGSSQVSFNGITDKPTLVSGSSQITYSGLSSIPSGIVSGSAQIADFGIFATTGSNQFNGNQAITGSLTTTGTIVAQTLNVQQVTSSIVYSSGSNIFGNELSNTQQFTGSVLITGSIGVNRTPEFTLDVNGDIAFNRTNKLQFTGGVVGDRARSYLTGDVNNNIFVYGPSSNLITTFGYTGNVGIGATGMSEKLTVDGNILLGGDYNLAIDITTNGNGKVGRTDRAYLQINRSNFEGFLSFHTTSTGAGGLSERLRITSTGNVGIGTSNPSTRLDIANGTLTLPTLRGRTYQLSDVASANPNFIIGTGFNSIPVRVGDTIDLPFDQTRTVTAVTDTQITVNAAWTISFSGSNVDGRGGIVFQTNNADRLTINSSGNVGIGTTNPPNKLSVLVDGGGAEDGITIGIGSQGDGIKIVQRYLSDRVVATLGQSNYGAATDSGALRLYDVGGTETVRLSGKNAFASFITSGNVGIGTDSPTTTLNVGHPSHGIGISYLGSSTLPALAGIFTSDGTAGGQTGYGSLLIKARSDFGGFYSINFFTAASNNTSLERMRITSAGTVQPGANGTQDLGTSSLRWATIYTSDLSLSNGIGDYTIVEGEHDLFLYNNKNNKVYKFLVEEVDPSTATPKKS